MEKLTIELYLQSAVSFTGRLGWNEVPEYIAGFDLCYMGNHQMDIGLMYHSPLKLYEYVAMARPVIASTYVDVKEILVSGEHGYLFEPGEIEDLKRLLPLAYQDRPRCGDIGRAARERVIEKASWQYRVREMLPRIEQILEGRHAHPSA